MALTGMLARLQGGFIGLSVGGAMSRALRPIFELLEQEAWYEKPNRILNPNQLAQLVATALTDFGPAAEQAARDGFNANKLAALVQLSLTTPTIGQAMDARRREAISEEQYLHVLRKAGIEPQYDGAMLALLDLLPNPTDLIRFAVREVYNPEQRALLDLDAEYPTALTAAGARLGYSEATLRDYWAAQWQLPSYEQLATMLFRRAIDHETFTKALKAINIAPVWRSRFEEIARRIPTPTDYLRLVRRGVYTPAEREGFNLDAEYPAVFTEKMALHGMIEQDARDLWAGGWRLPSARQLYQMLWRGEITEAQLNIGLRALDYPIFWRNRLANIARPVPPRVAVTTMIRNEVLTPEQGHEYFMQLGYTDHDAGLLVQISLPDAAGPEGAGTFATRALSRLFTVAHDEYLDGSIGATEAESAFGVIGVPARDRPRILEAWDAEAALARRELTPAQIKKAVRNAVRTREWAIEQLVAAKMTLEDANIFLDEG